MHPANYARFAAMAIWGLSTLMVFSLFKTAQYGARLRKQNIYGYGLVMLQRHRRWAWKSVWITVTAVTVIESSLRIFKLPYIWFFLHVHVPFLGLYTLFLILALIFDGLRYPGFHNKLGRAAQWFGLFTTLTGDWLVYVLLWLPFCGK